MRLKLFHASKTKGTLNRGYRERSDSTLTFLTTDMKFIDNKVYGEHLFEVDVEINSLFNSTNCNDIEGLYKAGFKLSDPYLNIEDGIDGHDEFGWDDDDLYEGLEFGEMEVYRTASAFCNSKTIKSDTWEAIEESKGVLTWISQRYDAILILERGVTNYIIFKEKCIKNIKQLN